MDCMHKGVLTAAIMAAFAGAALAQPRVVIIGDGTVVQTVSNDGATALGSFAGGFTRWTIGANSLTSTPLASPGTGGGFTAGTDDCQFGIGSVPNINNLGGLGVTQQMAGRWTSTTNTWADLGLMTPNAGLGVTGSGQSGNIHTARDISATGRFVAGQGYVAPNNSFRFRPWLWDSQAMGGAGEMIVLPTSFNTSLNRYRDGRAIAVSDDGQVIIGGEDPNTSSGRLVCWRYNTGTSQYDMSYMPDGVTSTGSPAQRTVDNFLINAAGTIVVGSTFEYNAGAGFQERWLGRWTWDAGTSSWTRTLLYREGTQNSISSWWNNPGCPIPPDFTPTAMSDDGNTVVGILRYSTCGSFVRSGFIWTADDGGTMSDFYDAMVAAGADMTQFTPSGVNIPPLCGFPLDVSADGRYIVGNGTLVQSSGGPGYWIDLLANGGGGCIPPSVTINPPATLGYSRCSSITLNAGASGSPLLTYQWHKDGQPLADTVTGSSPFISGSTTNRLFISSVTQGEVGSYSCTITGGCGGPVQTSACVVSIDSNGTPAANDTCATAQAVGEGTNVLAPAQNLCGAWQDEGLASCGPNSRFDRWYVWTPTFTGDARIEACGSNVDTVVSAYAGCGGFELACNDNRDTGPSACSSTRSRIARLPVTINEPVSIRVALSSAGFVSTGSTYNLSITQAPPAAANDSCGTATTVGEGSHAFDLTEATSDGLLPSCAPTTGTTSDVWFLFAPECDGVYRLQTCGSAISNPILTVYDQCGGTEIACNNDVGSGQAGCTSQQARISDLAVRGSRPVLVRVAASGNTLPSNQTGTLGIIRTSCLTDLNDDGNVDQDDVIYLINVIAGGDNPTGINPDFNCDGNPDQDDVTALINTIGGGGCP